MVLNIQKEGIEMNSKQYEEDSKEYVKVLLTSNEYVISGKLYLPLPSSVKNPTIENLLFYALNSGKKFIALHECIITDKNEPEYQPEHVKYFNINLDLVHTCRIIPDDDK